MISECCEKLRQMERSLNDLSKMHQFQDRILFTIYRMYFVRTCIIITCAFCISLYRVAFFAFNTFIFSFSNA